MLRLLRSETDATLEALGRSHSKSVTLAIKNINLSRYVTPQYLWHARCSLVERSVRRLSTEEPS